MRSKHLAVAALLAATVLGCGSGEARRYPVQGTVTLDGKPYPDATIEFVPDPSNVAISSGSDLTGPEGNFIITSLGRAGLPLGKYKVVVSVKPPASSPTGDSKAGNYEDEIQRQMVLESRGIDPNKQAGVPQKPGGTFEAEVLAEDNTLSFDVKSSTKAASR